MGKKLDWHPWKATNIRHDEKMRRHEKGRLNHIQKQQLYFKITIGFFDLALSSRIKEDEKTRHYTVSFDEAVLARRAVAVIRTALLKHSLGDLQK